MQDATAELGVGRILRGAPVGAHLRMTELRPLAKEGARPPSLPARRRENYQRALRESWRIRLLKETARARDAVPGITTIRPSVALSLAGAAICIAVCGRLRGRRGIVRASRASIRIGAAGHDG